MPYWKLVTGLILLLLVGWVIAENAPTMVRLRLFGYATGDLPLVVVIFGGMLIGALAAAPSLWRLYYRQTNKRKELVDSIKGGGATLNSDRPSASYEPADRK